MALSRFLGLYAPHLPSHVFTCVSFHGVSRCSRMWAQEEEEETKEFCFTELELGFLEGTHIWEVEGDPQFCLAESVN